MSAATLARIDNRPGQCAECGRPLTRVFVLTDGTELGRACCKVLTGWVKPDPAVRIAEVARRRVVLEDSGLFSHPEHVTTLAVDDRYWGADEAWRSHFWATCTQQADGSWV